MKIQASAHVHMHVHYPCQAIHYQPDQYPRLSPSLTLCCSSVSLLPGEASGGFSLGGCSGAGSEEMTSSSSSCSGSPGSWGCPTSCAGGESEQNVCVCVCVCVCERDTCDILVALGVRISELVSFPAPQSRLRIAYNISPSLASILGLETSLSGISKQSNISSPPWIAS